MMMRPESVRRTSAWLLLGGWLGAGEVAAADYSGLASIENYYTRDDTHSQDFDFLQMNLRFDAVRLDEAGHLSFHFAGRERLRLGANDYYPRNNRSEWVDVLNLEGAGLAGRWDVVAGRLRPREFPLETVDGVNLVYRTSRAGIGLFGGLKPDPYTHAFTTDYSGGGAYVYYRSPEWTANLAYARQDFMGRMDRQYLYGLVQYYPVRPVSLYGSTTLDIPPAGRKPRLTNGIGEITFRGGDYTNLTLGYNQFRTVQLYQSMVFQANADRQQSYYARGHLRMYGQNVLFGRYEHQIRDYVSVEGQQDHADTYQGGVRNGSLWGSGLSVSGSATRTHGFGYTSVSYDADISRLNWNVLELSATGSRITTRYDLTGGEDRIRSVGLSAYYFVNNQWNVGLTYQGYRSTYYKTDMIFTRLTYRFKSDRRTEKK